MDLPDMNFIANNTILIFFFLLFILLIIYISDKVGKKKANCKQIKSNRFRKNNGNQDMTEFYSLQDSIRNGYFEGNITINNTPVSYDYRLKDFYIKTAHNCFCSGNFSNDYVDTCAIENCASYGVRALDMQIFSMNHVPVIAANSINTNLYKQTYNSIPLKAGLSKINDVYRNENFYGTISNTLKNDPLFIIFRIHYDTNVDYKKDNSSTRVKKKQIRFYNKIYDVILSQFNLSQLASNDYRNDTNALRDRGSKIGNLTMKSLSDKVFIFVILNDEKDYDAIRSSKLNRIVDLYGNEMNNYHYNEMLLSDSEYKINQYVSSDQLSLCLPTRSPTNHNFDFIQAMKKGTQFIAMNFQNDDSLLSHYNQFFIHQYGDGENGVTSPYIKKPDHMIKLPLKFSD